MKLIATSRRRAFSVLAKTRSAQAALMVLKPGQDTGEPANEHPQSEQWLFVVSGSGRARVGRRRVTLRRDCLLLIGKGEIHKISNTGRQPLVTLNIYCPPAYTPQGKPK
jgi:mannose-6-phosphate isomerase-like protein (cupin superfamily)